MFKSKRHLLLAALLASLSLWPFQSLGRLRLWLFPVSLCFFLQLLKQDQAQRETARLEADLALFFGHVANQLGAGHSLDHVLMHVAVQLHAEPFQSQDFEAALGALSAAMQAGLPLDRALKRFAGPRKHPTLRRFLSTLPVLHQEGARLAGYLRQSQMDLLAEAALKESLHATQASLRSESLILTSMPFLMRFLVGQTGFHQLAEAKSSLGLDLLVYAGSLLALWLCRHFLQLDLKRLQQAASPFPSPWLLRFPKQGGAQLFERLSPRTRGRLQHLFPKSEALLSLFWASLERMGLCFVSALLLLRLAKKASWGAFFFALLPLVHALILLYQARQHALEWMQLSYPPFLHMLSQVLLSGLSLDLALRLCLQSFGPEAAPDFQAELHEVERQLLGGRSAGKTLQALAVKLPVPELASILYACERYAKEGGSEGLELIRLRSEQAKLRYQQLMQKRLARQSLWLYLPMMLDLGLVLFVTMAPALQSFQAF